MNEGERIYHDHVRSAIEALYNWVGERINDCTVGAEQSNNRIEHAAWIDMQGCYNKTKKKMQTLFASVIDFEVQEESKENGL